MIYHSTRNQSIRATDMEAILQGMAPDGGLYVPSEIPSVDFSIWKDRSFLAMAGKLFALFFPSLSEPEARKIAEKAYQGRFDTDTITPVHRVSDTLAFLELWHGPTLAFKDIALSALPHLMQAAQNRLGHRGEEKGTEGQSSDKILILTATSGDTGKAAMEGFAGIEGFGVQVFYPARGVSEAQRRQMNTHQQENVMAYAVDGNFDDCQRGVKAIFTNQTLQESLRRRGIRISSANSINVGRLIPQITYYVFAYFSLLHQGMLLENERLDVVVPTGNFGDFLAGYYAKKMGLPLGRLIVASNQNHVLSDFGQSGTYDANRSLALTTSPSMDILVSSNLERFLYHETGDVRLIREKMNQLRSSGRFQWKKNFEDVEWGWAKEAEVFEAIRQMDQQFHYVIDPHTAVGVAVAHQLRQQKRGEEPRKRKTLVLSTSSPFKFPATVFEALGESVPFTLEEQWDRLATRMQMPLPLPIQKLRKEPQRKERFLEKDAMEKLVLDFSKGV